MSILLWVPKVPRFAIDQLRWDLQSGRTADYVSAANFRGDMGLGFVKAYVEACGDYAVYSQRHSGRYMEVLTVMEEEEEE